jgi:transposase
VDGYKRHILKDIDSGLVRAVGITPANAAEASVTQSIAQDLQLQEVILSELHIDRAYLSCHWVKLRDDSLKIFCKAYPVRRGDKFEKTAFVLDGELKCYSRRQKAKGKRQLFAVINFHRLIMS